MPRCPATDTLTVDGQPLELRCVHWSEDPDGRHDGDHLIHTPPAMGDDHTWANEAVHVPKETAVADEHVFTVSIEASGEVTPAPHPEQTDTDEAAPLTDDEEPTDG